MRRVYRKKYRKGLSLTSVLLSLLIVVAGVLATAVMFSNKTPAPQIAGTDTEKPISKTSAEVTPNVINESNVESSNDVIEASGTEDTAYEADDNGGNSNSGQNVSVQNPEETDWDKISAYVSSLTLREKICQMMIVTLDALTGVAGTTVAGSKTQAGIEQYPVGGIIHFAPNITSKEQITLLNTSVQSYAKTPMFISVDEEGGRVGRLKTTIGAHSLDAMLSYEGEGEVRAIENAKVLASALRQYGFNTDFAPVADVWSNPRNTVIGDRAYSSDYDSAAVLVSAAVRGFNESNIICALKHFPGHGDTKEDSHNGTAHVNKSIDELRAAELKTFASGIGAGADMVMLGHLVVPSIDTMPATLSRELIDILRGELGFDGVVITDSLAMSAITANYSTEYVAVTAVNAGVDILLMPNGIEETIEALTSAVEDGTISGERIDASVFRIISLKFWRGIILA